MAPGTRCSALSGIARDDRGHPKNTGQIHGNHTEWTLVTPVNLQPYGTSGLQPMRITLVPGGSTSDFQVYNLFVDPRMR